MKELAGVIAVHLKDNIVLTSGKERKKDSECERAADFYSYRICG